jgi:hypothetical protein
MENTVIIKLSEYEKLKNTFENSELKKEIENKNKALRQILNESFVEFYIPIDSIRTFNSNSFYYFKKDKTPLWIKKFFN